MEHSFSQILKDLRTEKKLSQLQLAEKLNYTQGVVSGWESGSVEPKATALLTIAHYFGVSVGYLLGVEDDFGAPIADVMHDVHTSEETRLLEVYRKLSPDMKQTLWSLLDTWNPSTVRKNKV